MPTPADHKLCQQLQGVAESLDHVLESLVEKRVGFVLIVAPLGEVPTEVQYVSNVQRPDGTLMLDKLRERWEAGLPDIPTSGRH